MREQTEQLLGIELFSLWNVTHTDNGDSKDSADLKVISNISLLISDAWKKEILKGKKFRLSFFRYFFTFLLEYLYHNIYNEPTHRLWGQLNLISKPKACPYTLEFYSIPFVLLFVYFRTEAISIDMHDLITLITLIQPIK